jgi:dTDP-4-dehydrorhamnose reductase
MNRDHHGCGSLAIRILLIGAAGQVGSQLRVTLAPLGEMVATDRATLDLTDEAAIRATVRSVNPDLIVNAAAYTEVDPAEAEPELALMINGRAPEVMAEEARRANAALVHYSTDYVFSGSIRRPYREDDAPDPINSYGKSKLAGEKAIAKVGAPHLIMRTSWVFGSGGKGFFNTIIRLAREREELRVVDDQIGSPNWSRSVADATAQILTSLAPRGGLGIVDAIAKVSGLYHVCGEEPTNRYRFAEEILALYRGRAEMAGLPPLRLSRLIAVRSDEFPSPAPRPSYSVLSCERVARTFGVRLPSWREQLARAFERDGPGDADRR